MKIMIRQNVYPKAIISDLSAPGSLFFFQSRVLVILENGFQT